MKCIKPALAVWLVVTLAQVDRLEASVTRAFTYQGRLSQSGAPYTGLADFEFRLYDAPTGGTLLGSQSVADVAVADGLFSVTLNGADEFGTSAFNGQERWLEIVVNGQTLASRQPLTATPYALYALDGTPPSSLRAPDGTPDPALVVDDAGEIGIGVTIPANRLHVGGGTDAALGAGGYLQLGPTGATNLVFDDDELMARNNSQFGPLHLNQDGGSVLIGGATASGKVGIGTLDPLYKLQVGDAGIPNSEGVMRFESCSASGLSYRGWNFGVPETDDTLSGTGYSFVIDDPLTESNPEFLIHWQSGNVGINVGANPPNPHGFSTVLAIQGKTTGSAAVVYQNPVAGRTWSAGVRTDGQFAFFAPTDGSSSIVYVPALGVTGGSDIAEPFNIAGVKGEVASADIQPGMVVSIDREQVGQLRLSSQAYDAAVAGVISGAGGVRAGLILTQEDSIAHGKHPVALSGRVWCWCDADAGGPIAPGDLLTTSDTPGHAMKVVDRARSAGATLGKAMSSLESGRGLVLVLVNLQ